VDRERVGSIGIFCELPEHELDAVARAASEIRFNEGDALATEGEFGYALLCSIPAPPRYSRAELRSERLAPATSSARSRS
jgi:hypothetical protein